MFCPFEAAALLHISSVSRLTVAILWAPTIARNAAGLALSSIRKLTSHWGRLSVVSPYAPPVLTHQRDLARDQTRQDRPFDMRTVTSTSPNHSCRFSLVGPCPCEPSDGVKRLCQTAAPSALTWETHDTRRSVDVTRGTEVPLEAARP